MKMIFKISISNVCPVTPEVTDMCSLWIMMGDWDGASCPQSLLPFCPAVDALEKREEGQA